MYIKMNQNRNKHKNKNNVSSVSLSPTSRTEEPSRTPTKSQQTITPTKSPLIADGKSSSLETLYIVLIILIIVVIIICILSLIFCIWWHLKKTAHHIKPNHNLGYNVANRNTPNTTTQEDTAGLTSTTTNNKVVELTEIEGNHHETPTGKDMEGYEDDMAVFKD